MTTSRSQSCGAARHPDQPDVSVPHNRPETWVSFFRLAAACILFEGTKITKFVEREYPERRFIAKQVSLHPFSGKLPYHPEQPTDMVSAYTVIMVKEP